MKMKKSEEIARARKRRAKLLAEFNRLNKVKPLGAKSRMAEKHGLTRARIGKLLEQAEKENADGLCNGG